MNRRKFLQLLGLAVPAAAVAPQLMLAAPEPQWTFIAPRNVMLKAVTFPVPLPAGTYKYVRMAHPQSANAGDVLWFTDVEQTHVVPMYFKIRQPPLQGHAMALNTMRPGDYGWVRMVR